MNKVIKESFVEANVKIDKVKKGKVNNKVNKFRALRKRNGN